MNAEELLKSVLAKDETVKWSAKPEPYSITNEENKKSTFMLWAVAAAALVILNVAYIAVCVIGDAVDFKIGVLIITVGVPVFMFVNPLRDEMHIAKQITAITNKRLLVYHKSGKVLSVSVEDIDEVKLEESTDAGRCHLRICSAAVIAPPGKLRSIAISGKLDKDDKCVGLIFYHIDAQEGARAYDVVNSLLSERSDDKTATVQ
ncbi:MAG: hypothetical protein LBK57_10660 [Clostridiales Family XIII bacterium]|jgi:hypothetical protein|nr:hypothetical protein [Clostridiales Family XIII bacterium]